MDGQRFKLNYGELFDNTEKREERSLPCSEADPKDKKIIDLEEANNKAYIEIRERDKKLSEKEEEIERLERQLREAIEDKISIEKKLENRTFLLLETDQARAEINRDIKNGVNYKELFIKTVKTLSEIIGDPVFYERISAEINK